MGLHVRAGEEGWAAGGPRVVAGSGVLRCGVAVGMGLLVLVGLGFGG